MVRPDTLTEIVFSAVAFGIIGGIITGGLCFSNSYHKKINAYEQSIKILDKNHDGRLYSEEIKLFYEEMKIDPYSLEAFKKMKTKELEKFNFKYQEEYNKKNGKENTSR
ncbi:hypothetical protein M0R19_02970 [Candidatus Pacearchaeota archaeon]|jgi:hypothetical protein|nr:hypothetical protein [Candidatus Pacearchaeota archaeon]